MGKYLSVDTEATGLFEDSLLISVAFVPVDVTKGDVRVDLGWECMVKCPSFQELKPTLSEWVVDHMQAVIEKAHAEGVTLSECQRRVSQYLKSAPITAFFANEKPVLLGKSLSALDLPLMTRSFGHSFMDSYFHHHTVDVTCTAHSFVDAGLLPEGHASTTKLMQHFGIREEAEHCALADAIDMARIYVKMIARLRSLKSA